MEVKKKKKQKKQTNKKQKNNKKKKKKKTKVYQLAIQSYQRVIYHLSKQPNPSLQ